MIAAVLAGCESRAPQGDAGGESGPRVAEDWRLRDVSTSAETSLSAFRGKVVFLNVWATWCPPCVMEMPSIARLYERFRSDPNVAFLLVSVDDDSEKVRSFLEKNGYTMPTYLEVARSSAPAALQTRGIPATFILDGEGVIRRSKVGAMEWDSPAIIEQIERLSRSTGTKG
jgi:thiol-disulfide isomerase/thioredoxin